MSIQKVTFRMLGRGPVLFGRPIHEPKRDDESHEQLDQRTWQQRAHVSDGILSIPSTAVHRSLVFAGSWLSMKLSGNKTFTARLRAGVLATKPYFHLMRKGKPLTIDDVTKEPIYVPSDGKVGGTKRVWRLFPKLVPDWEVEAEFLLTDPLITADVFERHCKASGLHDGVGSMRIGRGGPNGMWQPADLTMAAYEL